MSKYTSEQLLQRDSIIQSQKLLWNFLDSDTINKLVDLFDTRNITKSKTKIEEYIENEGIKQGLETTNIKIESEVSKNRNNEYSLYIDISKDGIKFVHLSIHLSVTSLEPKNTGVLHVFKNIYKAYTTKSTRGKLYALISVQEPADKPHSLKFSIANGYTTSPEIQTTNLYDPMVQKEMTVILIVLNRLFDEDDEYYIGNTNRYISYHNKTSPVLQNMNAHTNHVTRKNKGRGIIPFLKNGFHSTIHRRPRQKTPRQKQSVRTTRKRTLQKSTI